MYITLNTYIVYIHTYYTYILKSINYFFPIHLQFVQINFIFFLQVNELLLLSSSYWTLSRLYRSGVYLGVVPVTGAWRLPAETFADFWNRTCKVLRDTRSSTKVHWSLIQAIKGEKGRTSVLVLWPRVWPLIAAQIAASLFAANGARIQNFELLNTRFYYTNPPPPNHLPPGRIFLMWEFPRSPMILLKLKLRQAVQI